MTRDIKNPFFFINSGITKIFDKIDNIKSIIVVTGTLTIVNYFFFNLNMVEQLRITENSNNHLKYDKLCNIDEKTNNINNNINNINNNINNINNNINNKFFIESDDYQKMQNNIQKCLDISIEIQKQNIYFLETVEQVQCLLKTVVCFSEKKKTNISIATSTSDFEKYIIHLNTVTNNNTIQAIDDEDNELENECYDILPCSNIKKATSTGFFYWK